MAACAWLVEPGPVRYLRQTCDPAHPSIEIASIDIGLAGRGAQLRMPQHPGRGPRMNLQSDPARWASSPETGEDLSLAKFAIGQGVLRTEDPRLVRGEGCF